MKKYIIYSIIYLLIYTISSCKDDDELGINTMTATINGETKLFDVIEARPYPAISEFIITGIICDDTKQKLILSLPMDLEIGTSCDLKLKYFFWLLFYPAEKNAQKRSFSFFMVFISQFKGRVNWRKTTRSLPPLE